MLTAYALDGLKAGLVAGLAFGLFVVLVGNPLVSFADELAHEGEAAIETIGSDAGDHHEPGAHVDAADAGGEHHEAAVSSTITNVVSVGSGTLWGIFLGIVVFGIGYYFLEPAIPGTGATKRYVLAAAGFVTVSGAPWLALPPQPPGVEPALPARTRVVIYGLMLVAGALASGAAWSLYARLDGRVGGLARVTVSLSPYAALPVLALAAPVTPGASPLPADLTAAVTGLIVVGQTGLWFVLAAVHVHLGTRTESEAAIDGDLAMDDAPIPAD
jgi:hypothetical protein